ncbi:MAG: MBL fold metallo-hydrolase [Alphaproteobacteria bacterium]|nr:MBL fold metallo-hydrolase [Alphaproteobacteria bacterium]
MKICIHRGTNEIGGNCIELSTEKTRILLDVGTPLASMEERSPWGKADYLKWLAKYKVPVQGAYADDASRPVDAIFISHNHGDHYGMLPLINPKIPVYMSGTLKHILLDIEPLKGDKFDVSHLDIREIAPNETVQIGDFTVIAHPVDHSPAAMAFEISDGVQRVLYTGDIRFHSSQSYKSWKLSDTAHAPDYLIMEGTRLSRQGQPDKYPTEAAVRQAMKDMLIASDKLTFISLSAQNLDRICSLIGACTAARRSLVIKPYTAELLEIFHNLSPRVPNAAQIKNLRVYFTEKPGRINKKMESMGLLDKYHDMAIDAAEIAENPSRFVIEYNKPMADEIFAAGLNDYDFIYSMWHGYLTRQSTWDDYKDRLVEIHASGHARVSDLKKFVAKISPQTIIPIHTECKDMYESEFGVPALVLDDNQPTEL